MSRRALAEHRLMAMLLLAMTLAAKLLVPQGYMLGADPGSRTLTVQLCFDGLSHRTVDIVVPTDGKPGSGKQQRGQAGDGQCPFGALGFGTLAGADAPLLALAFAFILLLGFAPTPAPPPTRARQLRPPLRGPPRFL